MDENSNEILSNIAKLDTCVTVVDASNFFNYFNTADSVADRYKDVDETDERTITELMIDQLEFADVILINKLDLIKDPKEVKRIKAVIRKLNMHAEIIGSVRSGVPMNKITNTGKFNFEEAKKFDTWLEKDRYDIQPETEEYGISSFVYQRDRPFDSSKLVKNVLDKAFNASVHVNVGDPEDEMHPTAHRLSFESNLDDEVDLADVNDREKRV